MKLFIPAAALLPMVMQACAAVAEADAVPFTTFAVPGAISIYPVGVNSHNVVAGIWQDPDYISHGFMRAAGGAVVTFDVDGAKHTDVYGLNDKGQIVGAYQDAVGEQRYHGFIREPNGKIKTIPVDSDFDIVVATGINTKGDVCGFYYKEAARHEFLRLVDGTFVSFDVDYGAGVNFINDADEIAGTFQDGSGVQSGFVRTADGKITVLNPGTQIVYLFNINNKGAVAGSDDIGHHGFVWDSSGNFSMYDPEPWSAHINDKGVISGGFAYPYRGRLFERNAKGKIRFVPPHQVNGLYFAVDGFNNHGTIVGTANGRGFLWNPGAPR